MIKWTIFLSTIFLLLGHNSSGQVDTSKIKILSKEYNKYITAGETDLDDSNNSDTLNIYQEIFEYSYPYIQTADKYLNEFINDTIRKIVGDNNSSPKIKWGWKDISDKPAENYMNYKTHFISPYFISITIHIDSYSGGGGNGSSHSIIALTFDLVNKKVLTTTDIFKKQSYPTAYKIFKQQFDSLAKSEFLSQDKFNRPDSLLWVQNAPFALFADKIILYTAVSYGHGYYDGEIIYEFEKLSGIFAKNFLTTVKEK